MSTALVIGLFLFLIVAGVMSNRFKQTKKRAVADLEMDQKTVGQFDIHELVESEIEDLGIADIDGTEGLPRDVLLKAWRDGAEVVASCNDRTRLRFVLREGVAVADATQTDVKLECRP